MKDLHLFNNTTDPSLLDTTNITSHLPTTSDNSSLRIIDTNNLSAWQSINNNNESPKSTLQYSNIINKHTKLTKTKNLTYKTCLKNAIIIDLNDDRYNKNDAIIILDNI